MSESKWSRAGASPNFLRRIVVAKSAWDWLKKRPGGPSRWINFTVGEAMRAEEAANVSEQLRAAKKENARLREIINALGADPDAKPRRRRRAI